MFFFINWGFVKPCKIKYVGKMSHSDFLKEQFNAEWKSFHYHVISNLYDFVSSGKHKDDILKNLSAVCLCSESQWGLNNMAFYLFSFNENKTLRHFSRLAELSR